MRYTLMNEPFPISVTPTPIINAAIEIRFDTDFPPAAVFGVIYGFLADKYPKSELLPIGKIPEQVRMADHMLLDQPHNRLYNESSDEFSVLVGPKILSFVYTKSNPRKNYPGWTSSIKEKVDYVLDKLLNESNVIKKVNRLGIRYTDFFDGNIYDHTEFSVINQNDERDDTCITQLSQTKKVDGFVNKISISNESKYQNALILKKGSVIDIDTSYENIPADFKSNFSDYCEKAHIINKELFFKMLKQEYVDTLNPVYPPKEG